MRMGEMLVSGWSELVHVLRAAAPVFVGPRHCGQAVHLEGLHVAQGALLGDFEVRGDFAQGGMPPGFDEGKDGLAPGVHVPILRVFQHGH